MVDGVAGGRRVAGGRDLHREGARGRGSAVSLGRDRWVGLAGPDAVGPGSTVKTAEPMALELLIAGCTVTSCHKFTPPDVSVQADYGFSVAIAGNTAVVGEALRNSARGAVYVYERAGTVWTLGTTLTAPTSATGAYLGQSVAISGDLTQRARRQSSAPAARSTRTPPSACSAKARRNRAS